MRRVKKKRNKVIKCALANEVNGRFSFSFKVRALFSGAQTPPFPATPYKSETTIINVSASFIITNKMGISTLKIIGQ